MPPRSRVVRCSERHARTSRCSRSWSSGRGRSRSSRRCSTTASPPATSRILRYAIAAPGFAYILWRARGLPGLTRGDAARVAAAGLLVVVGYHMFLNIGTQHTTSGIAALVVALAPGMTMILAFALGLDRIRTRRVVGLAVAFVGVAIVVALGSGGELSLESAKGPLIVLGAPLAFALYNVILKPLLVALRPARAHRCDEPRRHRRARPVRPRLDGRHGRRRDRRPRRRSSCTSASSRRCSATSSGTSGCEGLGPTRAVSYTYAISPLAVIIGAIVLDETVTPWLVLGGALVIGGIAAAQGVVAPRARSGSVARGGAHSHAARAEPRAARPSAPARARPASDPARARAARRHPGSVRAERVHPALVVPRGLSARRPARVRSSGDRSSRRR